MSSQFFSGYNIVVRIPAGATNIDVRQHSFSGKSEDDNYLGELGWHLPCAGICLSPLVHTQLSDIIASYKSPSKHLLFDLSYIRAQKIVKIIAQGSYSGSNKIVKPQVMF